MCALLFCYKNNCKCARYVSLHYMATADVITAKIENCRKRLSARDDTFNVLEHSGRKHVILRTKAYPVLNIDHCSHRWAGRCCHLAAACSWRDSRSGVAPAVRPGHRRANSCRWRRRTHHASLHTTASTVQASAP